MKHHNNNIHEKLIHVARAYQKEYNDMLNDGISLFPRRFFFSSENDSVGSWEELEHPYQEGYFFTLQINESEIRKLHEDMEAKIRALLPEVVEEFVCYEKRPSWKKNWSVVDDIIRHPKKKDKKSDNESRDGHFFKWISAKKNDDGSVHPNYYHVKKEKQDFFNHHVRPFMTIEVINSLDWRGDKVVDYYFVLDKKWRKYFEFRRYERWITHRYVLNGEAISRMSYLNKKLWTGDGKRAGLAYILDRGHHRDMDWALEGKRRKDKVMIEDFKKEMIDLDI